MNRLVIAAFLVGSCLAMPQAGMPARGNPYVKILELESYQNGANYGHALQQEDGTATGQKIGPDGLVYGFYSYIQPDGNRVKVTYRAGEGVGYEVLSVEGIDGTGLVAASRQQPAAPAPRSQPQPTQSLHNTISQSLPQKQQQFVQRQPAPVVHRQPAPVVHRQPAPVVHRQPAPVVHRQPAPVAHRQPAPVAQRQNVLAHVNPLISQEPTPAPHRFDYPANLSLQRTGTGFRSSFSAI